MIITNCPRCCAMNATTTCTKCGWSQFTKSTVSTGVLLDDYKRLLFENRNLKERVAELEEQVWNLNLENERLEEAYWIDETILPDGTWKPSVRKLLERLEKAKTDLRLSDDLVKALDNRIAKLEAENDQLTAHDATERQDENARLKDYISKLEAPVPERNLQLAKASLRITELKAFIDQLIEAGDGMKSFLMPYVDGFRDSYPATSAWESLVKDWKEG